MKSIIIYDKVSGEILAYKASNINEFLDDEIRGSMLVDIDPFDTTNYVKNGNIEKRLPKPDKNYTWNGVNWIANLDSISRELRAKRNIMLSESDFTDTLSYKTRKGNNTYDAWQTYRQALRDITAQPGFPLDVVWPEPPATS